MEADIAAAPLPSHFAGVEEVSLTSDMVESGPVHCEAGLMGLRFDLVSAVAGVVVGAAAMGAFWRLSDVAAGPSVAASAQVSLPKTACEQRWERLPPDIRPAWPLAEFELKCRANSYVAVCANRTLSFSDQAHHVCEGGSVKLWWKTPDA